MKTHVFFCSMLKRHSLNIFHSENNFEKKKGGGNFWRTLKHISCPLCFPVTVFGVHGTDVATASLSLLYSWDWRPCSSVSIVTACGLGGPEIESRWGARFSAPVHAGSVQWAPGLFPGVRCSRGVTLTPHLLLVPR
jgi:hypothetical protein